MYRSLSTRQCLLATAFTAALMALPTFVRDTYVLHLLVLAMIFGTFGLSWNVVVGFVGLKTFGHQAFFGIGAYGSALISIHWGLSPWLTIILASLIAAAAGVVVGMPVLRIKSVPHVAIITLAFAEIVRITCANLKDLTNGLNGLWGIPPLGDIKVGPLVMTFSPTEKVSYFYVAAIMLLATFVITTLLVRSRFGLALAAIRDGENAAESLGVNLAVHKLTIFAISAFLVAIPGGFYAHYIQLLTPSAVIGPDVMVSVMAMVLVGGLGTLSGPIVGALALTLCIEAFRFLGDYRMLTYGAVIMLVIIVMPRGIVGSLNFEFVNTILNRSRRGNERLPSAKEKYSE
ncbi:branched-chain amino acid ABC transporter permease [Mesorhizobium sp. 2RAF21]|uniref:branched-chain amino acid ABC transporter permease n=1 Tax=Mesorhizobium sp. 2RAF21 TaxID=3232995 RepID=UPI003F975327